MCQTLSLATAGPEQPAESPIHSMISEVRNLVMNTGVHIKDSIESLRAPSSHGLLRYRRRALEKTLNAREIPRNACRQTTHSRTVMHAKRTSPKCAISIVEGCRIQRRKDIAIKARSLVELASILSSAQNSVAAPRQRTFILERFRFWHIGGSFFT